MLINYSLAKGTSLFALVYTDGTKLYERYFRSREAAVRFANQHQIKGGEISCVRI